MDEKKPPTASEVLHAIALAMRESKKAKAELLATLIECSREPDTEAAHFRADAALIRYIGDPEIADAYAEINKWYA